MVEAALQVLDEVVAEFEASCAGRLKLLVHRTEVSGGALECCGSHEDPTRWTGAFVRKDRAVVPLSAGERDRVVGDYARLRKAGAPIWKYPPPKVIVEGTAYHFAPGYGRMLVGQVRLGRRAVLLAAIGDTFAVIHVAGRARSVLHVGKPHSFRELDVDRLLHLQGRKGTGPQRFDLSGPVRPSPPIEAEHRRIVQGLTVDVGSGPTIAQVLDACFEGVADRARALKAATATPVEEKHERTAVRVRARKASAVRRVRGKIWVRPVLKHLCKLAILGHGNICGRVGEIIAKVREHFPDFEITAEALSDVLGLLHALGTCLVSPRADGERIWEINLAGLTDPRSALHRRLCRETKGRHLVDVAAKCTVGSPEKAAPAPINDAPLAAGVDAGEPPLDHDPIDITTILEELCRLPPEAGSVLLAATLKLDPPGVDSASATSGPERGREAPLDVPDPSVSAAAPASAPDLTPTAPARGRSPGGAAPQSVRDPAPAPEADPLGDGAVPRTASRRRCARATRRS